MVWDHEAGGSSPLTPTRKDFHVKYNLRELPYRYRGKEVIDKSVDIGTLEVAFRLKLLAVLNKDGFAKK